MADIILLSSLISAMAGLVCLVPVIVWFVIGNKGRNY